MVFRLKPEGFAFDRLAIIDCGEVEAAGCQGGSLTVDGGIYGMLSEGGFNGYGELVRINRGDGLSVRGPALLPPGYGPGRNV